MVGIGIGAALNRTRRLLGPVFAVEMPAKRPPDAWPHVESTYRAVDGEELNAERGRLPF